jgi:hypothetical protein
LCSSHKRAVSFLEHNNELLPHSQHLKNLSPTAPPGTINGSYHQLVCVYVWSAWAVTHSDSTVVLFRTSPQLPLPGYPPPFSSDFSGGVFFDNASQPLRSSLVHEVEEHKKSGAEYLCFLSYLAVQAAQPRSSAWGFSAGTTGQNTVKGGSIWGSEKKLFVCPVCHFQQPNPFVRDNFSTTGSESLKTCIAQRCSPEHFSSGQSTQLV